jgi:hypothetical protein
MNPYTTARRPENIIAEQNRMAAQQRQPAPSTALAPAPKPSVPAMPDNRSSLQAYLDEVAPPGGVVGRLIKFDAKAGKFLTSDDGATISEGADFAVLADQTLVGWIRFSADGTPPDKRCGLLFDGFEMPTRNTLGDTDSAAWPAGINGRPEDPWKSQISVVLQNTDSKELYTFTTMSVTGRRAVGSLLRHYDRMRRTSPDDLPVVRLKPGGYAHRDERIGWVATPVFVVVGRTPAGSFAKPDTSLATEMDDDIPF